MPFVENCLEALKLMVLTKSAMMISLPCHVPHIAAMVSAHTDLYMSDVALLRLYNFLPARFPPSPYTKDVLAMYCGYKDYAAFCIEQRQVNKKGDTQFF